MFVLSKKKPRPPSLAPLKTRPLSFSQLAVGRLPSVSQVLEREQKLKHLVGVFRSLSSSSNLLELACAAQKATVQISLGTHAVLLFSDSESGDLFAIKYEEYAGCNSINDAPPHTPGPR